MKITFCGAAREVTGSCHLLEIEGKPFGSPSTSSGQVAQGKKILLDCGMFQGSNFNEGKNHDKFPFNPAEIGVLLVTHAHLDHVGRIPKLVKEGFRGKIYCTQGTKELAKLIWQDAWHIMKENQKHYNTPMLFEEPDIAEAYRLCTGINYDEQIEVLPGIKVIWKDAGHIFGSAFLEIQVKEGPLARPDGLAQGEKTIVFSGDIGNENEPIVRDTEKLSDNIDLLICESTYGDRIHEAMDVRQQVLLDLIKEAVKKGGTMMIPAFSLERTQELLYVLNRLSEFDQTLPNVPIFLDSPLAIDATKIYEVHPEYYDAEAARLHTLGDDFLEFKNLQKTYTSEESKKINNIPGAKIIIAGSGMMNGGRIVHHAFRYLSDPASTLLIVGYQAEGTLGRRLYEGATKVKIFNEEVSVRCTVKALGALSAHGDQNKLLKFVGSPSAGSPRPELGTKAGQASLPKKVYCVHGEPHAATELAHRIRDQFGIETFIPEYGETIEI